MKRREVAKKLWDFWKKNRRWRYLYQKLDREKKELRVLYADNAENPWLHPAIYTREDFKKIKEEIEELKKNGDYYLAKEYYNRVCRFGDYELKDIKRVKFVPTDGLTEIMLKYG